MKWCSLNRGLGSASYESGGASACVTKANIKVNIEGNVKVNVNQHEKRTD